MSRLSAPGLPEQAIRHRARVGRATAFPPLDAYGEQLFGAAGVATADELDALRLVPPVFMPRRLEKLIELGREPGYQDVSLERRIGGFASRMPVYVCAFGSTRVAGGELGVRLSRQAARLGIPMVIGENLVPVNGFGRLGAREDRASLLDRLRAYTENAPDGFGGVAVQQCTEDADAEVWNFVYSDPSAQPLLDSGRLAFELKVGQGAKPGLGGMTVVDAAEAERLAGRYALDAVFGPADGGDAEDAEAVDPAAPAAFLRSSSPGTFTEEILRQQVRLLRNNYPAARIWVKLHPSRDVAEAAAVAWGAGADAVTVDGAEGGTGWAPSAFLDQVGLPLAECLRRIGRPAGDLLASGRIWEGGRAVKALALGATAAGLGRAAVLAVHEDPERGLERLAGCLDLELRLLISALGKYRAEDVGAEDVWPAPEPAGGAQAAGVEERTSRGESV